MERKDEKKPGATPPAPERGTEEKSAAARPDAGKIPSSDKLEVASDRIEVKLGGPVERTPAAAARPLPPSSPAAIKGRAARGSLRRRFLLMLLVMTILPGYSALLLVSATVSRTLNTTVRQEAFDRARALASEFDQAITQRMEAYQAMALDEEFLDVVHGALLEREQALEDVDVVFGPFDLKRPPFLRDAPLYLVDDKGRIVAQVTDEAVMFAYPRPTPLEGAEMLARFEREMPRGNFASEPMTQDWNNPRLLIGTVLPPARERRPPMALVSPLDLGPIFEEAERRNISLGQRLVVVSKELGVLYTTHADEDLHLALNRARQNFFPRESAREPEFVRLQLRNDNLGVAYAPTRRLLQLSENGALRPVDWAVVQVVDLNELLAAVEPMYWTAIIVGLVLTIVALALALWVSGRMVRPIVHLTEGMQRYAQGDLTYRVDVKTRDELEILANAANEMAASLRASYDSLATRARELDEKASQLEMIHSISYSVNRVLELEKMFGRIIRELRRQIPCERLSLGMLDASGENLVLEYVHPADRDHLPRGAAIPMNESVMGRALKDQVLTVRRVRKDGKYHEDDVLSKLGMKVLCVVPLVATNGPVGTLNLASADENCFDATRIKLLERIADSLALAVEHSRLFTRVARFAEELEETVEHRTRELKTAQAKLVQAEKFAATGSIAAHIGHEVNNPLSIIKNYLRILSNRLGKGGTEQEDIAAAREGVVVIEEEIDRIARIIAQLRQVSRPSKGEMSFVDLPAEIAKLSDLFQGTLRKRAVEMEIILDPELKTVWACSDYLRQIVINLVRNSMDAMEEETGGIITIRTVRGKPDPESFCIEVQDTGCGISAENLSKIFDPFFTTKSEGKGTGLGLSVSFGLAQSMGGTMEAESTPGEGTTIRLILPLRTDQGSGDTVRKSEEDSPGVRREGSRIIIG